MVLVDLDFSSDRRGKTHLEDSCEFVMTGWSYVPFETLACQQSPQWSKMFGIVIKILPSRSHSTPVECLG